MVTEINNDVRFVTGVVLANGVPDAQEDVLDKKDIKQLFIKYLKHDTDLMHSYIRNDGVDLVANWITEIDRPIRGKTAPAGSWLATFKVTNTELIPSLDNHEINGFSLGSVSEEFLTRKFWFLNQPIKNVRTFQELDSVDNAKPVFISFVDDPSNGFNLEVEKPDVYINKSKENNMSEEQNNEIQEETITLSGLEKIKEIFGINKSATETVEPQGEVNVETKPTEPPVVENNDISNTELLEKIPNAVATGITSAFEKMAEDNKTVKTEEENNEENNEEDVKPVKTVPRIDKTATSKQEPVPEPNMDTNFYSMSGRDAFGCRIRK